MGKRIALVGDKTTTGGSIISGLNQVICMGKKVALVGDKATCPACEQGVGTIIEGASNTMFFGKAVVYDGCRVACGCPNNRIMATQSHMFLEPSSGKQNQTSPLASSLHYQASNSLTKQITHMFWSYGEDFTPLTDQSRFYTDINLHIKTLNYETGETVEVTLQNENGHSLTGTYKEIILSGVVDADGRVLIRNPLKQYTLNLNQL